MIQNYDDIASVRLDGIAHTLSKASKKILGEVRLFDLIVSDGSPLAVCHGVYCFYASDGVTCLYVGKVEGPQFIERLPSHLALSEGSRFNQFMRGLKSDGATFSEAAKIAKDCMLLLLPMPLEFVRLAERVLIERLNPKLNLRRSKSDYAGEKFDALTLGETLNANGTKEGAQPVARANDPACHASC